MRKTGIEIAAPGEIDSDRSLKKKFENLLTPMVGPTYHPAYRNSPLDFDVMAIEV